MELYRSYCPTCDTEYTWKEPPTTEDNDNRPFDIKKVECKKCHSKELKTELDWGKSIRSKYFKFGY